MLTFITSNVHKYEEARQVMPYLLHQSVDLPEIQSLDQKIIIQQKLQTALLMNSTDIVVEDIGLYLDCIAPLPGPFIKYFLQALTPEGIYALCEKYENYCAKALCVLGYAKNKETIHFFSGEIDGRIVQPEKNSPFGWDPIFLPNGQTKTFAQMTREEKIAISMRTKAFQKLHEFLVNEVG